MEVCFISVVLTACAFSVSGDEISWCHLWVLLFPIGGKKLGPETREYTVRARIPSYERSELVSAHKLFLSSKACVAICSCAFNIRLRRRAKLEPSRIPTSEADCSANVLGNSISALGLGRWKIIYLVDHWNVVQSPLQGLGENLLYVDLAGKKFCDSPWFSKNSLTCLPCSLGGGGVKELGGEGVTLFETALRGTISYKVVFMVC